MAVFWCSANVYAIWIGWGAPWGDFMASPARAALIPLWCMGGLLTVFLTGRKRAVSPLSSPSSKNRYVRLTSASSNVGFRSLYDRIKIAIFGASWACFLVLLARMDRKGAFVFWSGWGEEWVRSVGLIVFVVGGTLRCLAIRTREAHEVRACLASTSVYRYIRHPEYLGILSLLLGLSLVFHSGIGLWVVVLWMGVTVLRIEREEKALTCLNPGYPSYQRQTYHLLFGIY